jgi:hypothetical protein
MDELVIKPRQKCFSKHLTKTDATFCYLLWMQSRNILPLILLPLLLAAKGDIYKQVVPADRPLLRDGVDRYVRDQIKRDWTDLFEIKFPGFAIVADYDDLSGKAPVLSKQDFADVMNEQIYDGSRPFMRSFHLVSITPVKGGYEVRGCSKAQRESFHFKGILTFTAYVSNGQVRFGGWRYIDSMPQSCRHTEGSE